MARQSKTPCQRAEEQLAAANRAVLKLDRKVDALRTDLVAAETEQRAAIARRDHLAQHPDLGQTGHSTTPTTPHEAQAAVQTGARRA